MNYRKRKPKDENLAPSGSTKTDFGCGHFGCYSRDGWVLKSVPVVVHGIAYEDGFEGWCPHHGTYQGHDGTVRFTDEAHWTPKQKAIYYGFVTRTGPDVSLMELVLGVEIR